MPRTKKRIWFAVADSGRANFFALNEAGTGLVQAGTVSVPESDVKSRSRDLKSDRPGRSFSSSGGGTRHAIEPHHDYHKLEKHKFTVGVAKALDKSQADGKFDQLVLVAPRRTLGELRSVLSEQVRARVCDELAKDLTKHPADTLWPHLSQIAEKLLRAVV